MLELTLMKVTVYSYLLYLGILFAFTASSVLGIDPLNRCDSQVAALSEDGANAVPILQLQALGIFVNEGVRGLLFNGGVSFEISHYESSIQGKGNQSFYFEHVAMKELSKGGESFLGIGDMSVRAVLIPGFYDGLKQGKNTPSGADLLSVSRSYEPDPVFHIREVKSASLEQVNIDKAISQMVQTGETLLARLGEVHLAPFEVVVVEPMVFNSSLKNDYRLGQNLGQTFQLEQLVNGKWFPKTVSIGSLEVPIQVRLLRFP